jgi:hypothetical protein
MDPGFPYESGGKGQGGQLRFERACWVGHFGDFNRKIRPIYEAPAAARCCTQQSVHEYARHECRTPRGARGGVQYKSYSPFCAVLARFPQKTLPHGKNIWDILNKEFGLKFYTIYF